MSDFQKAVSNVTTGLSIVPVVLCLCFSCICNIYCRGCCFEDSSNTYFDYDVCCNLCVTEMKEN